MVLCELEGLIPLCQSILETRRITRLHGSAHFTIPLKTKVELPPILPSYPRLTSRIFIANMFHTIAEASSVIFALCQQFFTDTKSFELERLKSYIY